MPYHTFISPEELNRRWSEALPLWNALRHTDVISPDQWKLIQTYINDPFASPLLLTTDHVGLHMMRNATGDTCFEFIPFIKPLIRTATLAAINEDPVRFDEAFWSLLSTTPPKTFRDDEL